MAIRVGLIGLNYGERVHLPAYRANSRYEVVAVCARSPGRAQSVARAHHIPAAYSDPLQLIGAAEVDLVSLATPPGTHARLATAALAAGKHVVVEIAFAGVAREARALARLAREGRHVGSAAFVLRYVPHIRQMTDLLAAQTLGPLRLARLDFFSDFLARSALRWPWLWEAERGGGILAGFISHGLDLLCQWLGPVEAVDASLATLSEVSHLGPGLTAADDTGLLALHFKSGLLAAINFSAMIAHPRIHLEVHGARGSLLMQGFGDELAHLPLGAEAPRPVYPAPAYLEATRGQTGMPAGFQCYLDHLAGVITSGQAPAGFPTFEAGLEVTRLIDAARLASREGRRVRIDEIG